MRKLNRRSFLKSGAATVAASSMAFGATSAGAGSGKLSPVAFTPLPLGEIHPTGWLARQLRIQAAGQSGHLDEFWPDLMSNSAWKGGTGEAFERGPYYADGLLPLAWQLNDDGLKQKAMKFVNWTLDNQRADGMIGPAKNDDWWPRMVMVKVLAQYYDATAAAGKPDPRVLPVMTKYFHFQLAAIPARPLASWARYRWQDEVLVTEWLYDRTGDAKLLDLARLLQQEGFDWTGMFANFQYTQATSRDVLKKDGEKGPADAGLTVHGVNHSQAIKTAPVLFRLTGNPAERHNYFHQVSELDTYHGMPNGMFSCDEHLGGLDVSHGTELCSVVETMYSMEVALSTFGDATIGDRIEKIAFNALPGTFRDDMWAHQYDQQPNQLTSELTRKPWTTNGPESNLYGLEPHFGCCTANFHQGWPKFTQSLWMRTPDGGLAATLYAPCNIQTKIKGKDVALKVETEYPFRDSVRITVTPATPGSFPLLFRVPAWAQGSVIQVNGSPVPTAITPGTFARVDRTWKQGDVVELRFPMQPTVVRSFRQSVTLMRGPLVFSLDPGEQWVKLRDRPPTADWQCYPQAPWNYAVQVDEASAPKLEVIEAPVGTIPFSVQTPAVTLRVPARLLASWGSQDGVADSVPAGLQHSTEPLESLRLVPYGAAKLRITAFPQLASSAG